MCIDTNMETPHDQIMKSLGQLQESVNGVNRRLDKVNGRLDKHDTEINTINNSRSEEKGEKKAAINIGRWVWSLITVSASVIGAYFIKR